MKELDCTSMRRRLSGSSVLGSQGTSPEIRNWVRVASSSFSGTVETSKLLISLPSFHEGKNIYRCKIGKTQLQGKKDNPLHLIHLDFWKPQCMIFLIFLHVSENFLMNQHWERGPVGYRAGLLKGWALEQQRWHHLRTCPKCQFLGPEEIQGKSLECAFQSALQVILVQAEVWRPQV